MSTSKVFKNPFKYIFFVILVFYALVYGPYGIEDGDMGSIFGISWSMYNGYFPHRDFVYIKPAFSPFFHSLPIYISEEYAYLVNRYLYFTQVFLYSYLACLIAFKLLKLSYKNLYFIATISALVSVHNYAPMPWNTIDGIFFSVIGLYFITKDFKSWRLVALGGLFLFFGALCKQSFYFFPIIVGIFLLYKKEWIAIITLSISGLIFICSFLWLFWYNDALNPFIEQMFSFTSGSSLMDTGVKSYYLAFKFHSVQIVLALIIFWILRKYVSNQVLFFLINLFVAGIFLWLYYTNHSLYKPVRFGIIHILWVLGILFSVVKFLKEDRYAILIVLFSLAWCASISNGYNTPIDFFPPTIIAIALICFEYDIHIKSWKAILITSLYIGTFYFAYQYPYRERPRNELTYNLGNIFPRLKTIHTHKDKYNKYQELKSLSGKYDNFTILPSMTLGHYITDTVNPIGVDWVFNHHLANDLEKYKQKLSDKKLTVFIENFEGHEDNYEETSLLTMHVYNNWKLVEQLEYFRVYQLP